MLFLNQPVSMAHIHLLYKDKHTGDTRYRNRLKARIIEEFPDQLYFLTVDGKTPQVVVSQKGIAETTILQDKEILIKQTTSLLRNDIKDYMKSLEDTSWPPTIESLTYNDRKIPTSVKLFMDKLLTSPGHDSDMAECPFTFIYKGSDTWCYERQGHYIETFSYRYGIA